MKIGGVGAAPAASTARGGTAAPQPPPRPDWGPAARVTLSPEAAAYLQGRGAAAEGEGASSSEAPTPAEGGTAAAEPTATEGPEQSRAAREGELSEGEQEVVRELSARDAEVRAHEAAHLAAGGGLTQGGATFSYQTGPDGKRYAVGGEVSIDTSPGKTPSETIQRAQQIRAAALAPAEPSPQDRSVAASASRMEASARRALSEAAAAAATQGGEAAAGAEKGDAAAPQEPEVAATQGAGAAVAPGDSPPEIHG